MEMEIECRRRSTNSGVSSSSRLRPHFRRRLRRKGGSTLSAENDMLTVSLLARECPRLLLSTLFYNAPIFPGNPESTLSLVRRLFL